MYEDRLTTIVERILVESLACYAGNAAPTHIPHEYSWVSGKKSSVVDINFYLGKHSSMAS